MMLRLQSWWHDHSANERRFMAILGIAIALVFLWLGVWRPVTAGIDAGWTRQGEALDRFASVRARVALLDETARTGATGGADARVPIAQLVGQSAAEAGFMLDRAAAQGENGLAINIASARVGPLLSWLSQLEASGVTVQTISIVAGSTDGIVTVQANLQENGS